MNTDILAFLCLFFRFLGYVLLFLDDKADEECE